MNRTLTPMRMYIVSIIVAVLMGTASTVLTHGAEASPQRCAEDAQCWSWSTMGNLDRGLYVRHKRSRVVVDPCTFAYLDFTARIDWHRTPRLRGDEYARRHGCDWRLFAPDAYPSR